jgi:phospholipid-binding lipoprotein MlaA
MSVSALTTAMAVAAATVPDGEAPTPVAAFESAPIAVDQDLREVGPATGSEFSTPLVLSQSTAAPQSEAPDRSTESSVSTDPAQSTDPASSAQPGSQPRAPVGGQTEIIVTGRRPSPEDPLEELNSKSFKVTQSVDKSFVAPIAFAYEEVMPRPIRKGLRNFLHNLGEPVVFLNFLLQLKPGKAAETLGRFAINTTLGAGGLVDIAKRKPFNLPHRDNGFANTLGYYGVKPGPYFYLPLVGPTTLRDFIGGRLDLFVLPTIFGKWFQRKEIVIPVWVLSELGRRIEFDDELREIQATQDPYLAARTHYLQKRQAEIDALRGRGASTIKPPVPGPASSGPVPVPTSPAPVKNPPQDQISPLGGSFDRQPFDTGDLLGGLSIVGTSGYTLLAGDYEKSPIVDLHVNASHWLGVLRPAYTR